jgi:hypothetical protein
MTMTLDGVEDIAAMRERDGLKYPCPGRPAPGKTVEARRPAIHWIRQRCRSS